MLRGVGVWGSRCPGFRIFGFKALGFRACRGLKYSLGLAVAIIKATVLDDVNSWYVV